MYAPSGLLRGESQRGVAERHALPLCPLSGCLTTASPLLRYWLPFKRRPDLLERGPGPLVSRGRWHRGPPVFSVSSTFWVRTFLIHQLLCKVRFKATGGEAPLRHWLLFSSPSLERSTAPLRRQPRAAQRKKEGPETLGGGCSGP